MPLEEEATEEEAALSEGTAEEGASLYLAPAILARLPERDPQALEAFFDLYFDRVYGYIRRLVRDEHVAEDLTQEIFLHIHRALASYDPSRDLRPWVFTIATNKVRDFWRSRRHRDSQTEQSVEREGAADHLRSEEDRPGADLTRAELDAQVRGAVDELPEGMRLTVLLRTYEGMSFEAIGRVLDRSEVAVRKRYSRALETLRGRLGVAWQSHNEGAP